MAAGIHWLGNASAVILYAMPSVRIPALLRAYTGGLGEVGVEGGTVGEAMEALAARYPALRLTLTREGA